MDMNFKRFALTRPKTLGVIGSWLGYITIYLPNGEQVQATMTAARDADGNIVGIGVRSSSSNDFTDKFSIRARLTTDELKVVSQFVRERTSSLINAISGQGELRRTYTLGSGPDLVCAPLGNSKHVDGTIPMGW